MSQSNYSTFPTAGDDISTSDQNFRTHQGIKTRNKITGPQICVPLHELYKVLKINFGYEAFLPFQEEIIHHTISGKDALVLMPTGGGKSLCFQLPALVFDGLTLVISPLIALMKDQVDGLKANGIAAEVLNSSLTREESARIRDALSRKEVKILYVAPERLAVEGFRSFLRGLDVTFLAVDEAHCISQWGHDFRPDYLNLKSLREDFPHAGVLALTATATPRVQNDIVENLRLRSHRVFISSFNRPNLEYDVRPKSGAFEELVDLLRDKDHYDRSVIIYCYSRKETEELANDLCARGFRVEAYHAGLKAEERHAIQDRFIRDETPIITATIAFGMGIDKSDIRLVVHYSLPGSLENYYQETGRAGRDGLPATCVLFYSYADKFKQEYFIGQIEDATERKRSAEKLARMVAYCENFNCRRKFILEYFGENYTEKNCGKCDRCLRPATLFDADEIGRAVLECVQSTEGRFGGKYVIDILRGSRNERIVRMGHDCLPSFGQGRSFSEVQLREIVSLLMEKGFINRTTGEYPVVEMTNAGRQFLDSRERLMLPELRSAEKSAVRKSTKTSADVGLMDGGLFEELRRLRKQLADDRGVPPFVIFADTSLKEMTRRLPRDSEEFLLITGVGEQKLKWFGPAFLKKISEYCREHGIAMREAAVSDKSRHIKSPVSSKAARTATAGTINSTYEETRQLVCQRISLDEIAEERGLSAGTILSHLEKLVSEDHSLSIEHLRPGEPVFGRIKAAFEQSGGYTLTPVKNLTGDEYSFEDIRLVRIFLIKDRQE